MWPLGAASTDYDEGVYWQSLRAMAHGQPLFTGVFSSQPPMFLLSLYPLYLLFGQSLAGARLAVAIYSMTGVVAMYFVGRRLGGAWSGLLAALLLAVDPLFLTESHTLQAEAPAISFEVVAVALALAAMNGSNRRRIWLSALAGIALGAGSMIKLFDVVAVAPVFAYLASPFFSRFVDESHRLTSPTRAALVAGLGKSVPACLACLAGALATILLIALPYAANWGTAYDQVVRFHTVAAVAAHGSLRGNLSALYHVRSEYPLWLADAAALALAVWRRRWNAAPLVLWLLASVAVLLQQQPLFLHHVALLAVPLAALASLGPALAGPLTLRMRSTSARTSGAWIARLSAALVAVAVLGGVTISGRNDSRAAQPAPSSTLKLAAALRDLTLPSDYVVTDDQYIAGLADRNVLPQLVDTSLVRIQSGYLTATQLESLITATDARTILFASGRFDTLPGFRAWVEARFTALPGVGDGRMLYVKSPHGPAPV